VVDLDQVEQAEGAVPGGTTDLVPEVEGGFVPARQVAEGRGSVVALQPLDLGHGERDSRGRSGGHAAGCGLQVLQALLEILRDVVSVPSQCRAHRDLGPWSPTFEFARVSPGMRSGVEGSRSQTENRVS